MYNKGNTIEIISPEPIGTLTLGYDDPTAQNCGDIDEDGSPNTNIDKAIYSYNHGISTINDYCNNLITNRKKVKSVRSIGNARVDSDSTSFSTTVEYWENSAFYGKLARSNGFFQDNEYTIAKSITESDFWISYSFSYINNIYCEFGIGGAKAGIGAYGTYGLFWYFPKNEASAYTKELPVMPVVEIEI